MSERIVFISYSHDSPEHREWVLGLSERLRADGFVTRLDRYVNGTPDEGWPRWMLNRLDEATHVLVVCTETYYRRFRGHEVPGLGKGVDWEGALITQEIYDARSSGTRFVPVLRADGHAAFIPEPLRGATHYVLDSEERYQALLRYLAGADGIEPGPVGSSTVPPRPTAKPLTFPDGSDDRQTHIEARGADRGTERIHDSTTDSASVRPHGVEPSRERLKQRLTELLRQPEIAPLIGEFVALLRADEPTLEADPGQVAAYLVDGPRDRYTPVSRFLKAARKNRPVGLQVEPVHRLFSYLLQTLVRKCRQDQSPGATRIPASKFGTVELIGATHVTAPVLPACGTASREHRNGQRDALGQIAGHFVAETGTWEVEDVCRAIARDLLVSLDVSPEHALREEDPIARLRAELRPYDEDTESLPCCGVVVDHAALHNPARLDPVAARLRDALGELFSVYVYGREPGQETTDSLADWLHTTEEDLEGLVSKYHRHVARSAANVGVSLPEEGKMSNAPVQVRNVGANATVNIVTGTQTDAQIGHGNIMMSGPDRSRLVDSLNDLRSRAQAAADVDKQAYAEIDSASRTIEAELKKPEGADRSVLKKAGGVLGHFRDVASIAAAIEKIVTALGPFLI